MRDGRQEITHKALREVHQKCTDIYLRQIFSNLERCPRPSDDEIEEIINQSRPILTKYRIPNEHLNPMPDFGSMAAAIEKEYTVSHIIEYNGEVFYAMGRRLYALHQNAPLWTFRNTITGLGVLSEELLKKTKGKASVRRGKSALRTMVQRAA